MATYIVLYKFTAEGAKNIRDSVKRAGRIRQENARIGFRIIDVFWVQGDYDMVSIVDAPSEEAMMGAMLNVVGAGNVSTTTMRAFDALEMSRILAQTPSLADDEPAPAKKAAATAPKGKPAPKKAPKRK